MEQENIDFYKFKQFLADKSLRKAKENLNNKGIKLYGDMLCGFSYDEVWAHPNAFIKNSSIGWGLPAADFYSQQGQDLLKKKVRLFAERYDGIRVDASWTYATPTIKNVQTGAILKRDYRYKMLDLIDNEFKNIKGKNFDKRDIMHEFVASEENFSIFEDGKIKSPLQERMKIYTSEYITPMWGSNYAYKKFEVNDDSFIIGARNHDSSKIQYNKEQAKILAKILNLPENKINNLEPNAPVGNNGMIFN